jgi:hypothetical protein
MDDSGGRRWFGWETALGGLLLLLGIVVGLGQALELDLGGVGWLFSVIVPGLALLGVGLTGTGRLGARRPPLVLAAAGAGSGGGPVAEAGHPIGRTTAAAAGCHGQHQGQHADQRGQRGRRQRRERAGAPRLG